MPEKKPEPVGNWARHIRRVLRECETVDKCPHRPQDTTISVKFGPGLPSAARRTGSAPPHLVATGTTPAASIAAVGAETAAVAFGIAKRGFMDAPTGRVL